MKLLPYLKNISAIALFTAVTGGAQASLNDAEKGQIIQRMNLRADSIARTADSIWNYAELGFHETKSSALLQEQMKQAGFTVDAGVAGMPTAFIARYRNGKGGPVIAILAEFDALPGLAQEAVPERKPIAGQAAGHACGHHLFGAASAAAAIEAARWMKEKGIAGEIRLYGAPAEEGGSGKAYLVREGLFKDVDATLHWHAGDNNSAVQRISQANISGKFRFHGKSAHAAGDPQNGRSALDGVEILNHAANMLREHVPDTTRIHYVITNGGGAPNVVPDYAEVYYYVRHNDARIVRDVMNRVQDAAKGAAMATGTTVEFEQTGGVYALLPNNQLGLLMDANLRLVGGVNWTAEEKAFAEKLYTTFPNPARKLGSETSILPYASDVTGEGSSDVGDVSWVTPTAGIRAATWGPGTSAHSWQAVAFGGMSIGHKGAVVAAKTIALSALDLMTSPDVVAAARKELQQRRPADFEYRSLIGDRPPALNYRESGSN
ncbi:MAG: amidohydrolase [Sphingobium sp.]|nr:amidohydrolase [Sphingobium sp.]